MSVASAIKIESGFPRPCPASGATLLGILAGAILRSPRARPVEAVVPQHVEERNLTERGAEQVGALGYHRPDEEPAVGDSRHGQALRARVSLGHQPLGGGDAVVEHVEDLVGQGVLRRRPRLHPGAGAILEPAIRIGHGDAVDRLDHGLASCGGILRHHHADSEEERLVSRPTVSCATFRRHAEPLPEPHEYWRRKYVTIRSPPSLFRGRSNDGP